MAINNVNVKTAVGKRHTADLSTSAILTTDFLTPRVIYAHEFIPGESWKCRVDSLTRCLPMVKPSYSDISSNIRCFFVPFRTLFYRWNAWITNTNDGGTLPGRVPYFTNLDYYHAITAYDDEFTESDDTVVIRRGEPDQPAKPEHYDFMVTTTENVETPEPHIVYIDTYYNYNSSGRMVASILNGLGYKLEVLNDPEDYNNALPLLAYCKIYLDYYINPRNVTVYKALNQVLNDIYCGNHFNLGSQSILDVDYTTLHYFLNMIQDVSYSLDYFTSAWETPVGPDSGTIASGTVVRDPLLQKEELGNQLYLDARQEQSLKPIVNSDNDNPFTGSRYPILTQYLDTALHLMSDKFKRYQLSSIKPIDRYLTQRGYKLRSEYNNQSIYVGHNSSPFDISDVTSTGDEALGDYKGKMLNYNLNGNFEFDGEEFGMIILISTVVPNVRYYQGQPRYTKHTTRSHFFDPEMEKLGIQAIRGDELFATTHGGYNEAAPSDAIGYTDKFAEYKCNPHSVLSGDFIFDSRNTGYDCWHVWRDVKRRQLLDSDFREAMDRTQYDRIFGITDGSHDGFIQVFNIDVKASLPMSPMFESYDWCDDDTKSVNVKPNGSFTN